MADPITAGTLLWTALQALLGGAAAYGGGKLAQKVTDKVTNKSGKNKGVTSTSPVTFPGSANSPTVTAQNLGNEGSALFFSPYNQGQQSLMDVLGQLGVQGIQNIPNQNFNFEPIERQARENFSQFTIPSILERFNVAGNADSSGLRQSLGQAGAGLESSLRSLREQYGLQQRGQNIDMLNAYSNLARLGLTPRYESIYSPKGPSTAQSLATSILPGVAEAATKIGGQYLVDKYLPKTKAKA